MINKYQQIVGYNLEETDEMIKRYSIFVIPIVMVKEILAELHKHRLDILSSKYDTEFKQFG